MDFFESQDVARRKTGRLVMLFVLAVLAIMVAAYLVVAGALTFLDTQTVDPDGAPLPPRDLFDPTLLLAVGLGTLVVVAGGSFFKLAQLRGGGSVVAESLGGRRLDPNARDPLERKVLNVVEEMAIASGTPVPPVYMMDGEEGINAFAAGYSPGDAVLGVTRGCVEQLTRDELQGVVGHEFSHVFNGDMRLNIRLMGVMHGILVIGLLGHTLMRSAFWGSAMRRRDSKQGGGAAAIAAMGIGLMAVGFLGVMFGNIIKAAVSRQREFLADASAVQFTRNPEGIAGALKRIGGFAGGTEVKHPRAAEASHMFFGRAVSKGISGLFATHPPLAERIQRLDPSWDGDLQSAPDAGRRPATAAAGLTTGLTDAGALSTEPDLAPTAVDQVGHPTRAHLAWAAELIASLPERIATLAHEPYGARAVVYALLLDADEAPRERQLARLAEHADTGVLDETVKLLPELDRLRAEARLPLLDLAMPALHALSPSQYRTFMENVDALVLADDQIDLFEWTLQRILHRHLAPHFEHVSAPRVIHSSLEPVAISCRVLLSTVAHAGHADAGRAASAFAQGWEVLELLELSLLERDQCSLDAAGTALDALLGVGGRGRHRILLACATTIAADHDVTVVEAELLRAIADSLDCPVPPLLPGQRLV